MTQITAFQVIDVLKDKSLRAKWRISVLLFSTDIKNLLIANQRTSGIFITNRTFSLLQEKKDSANDKISSSFKVD